MFWVRELGGEVEGEMEGGEVLGEAMELRAEPPSDGGEKLSGSLNGKGAEREETEVEGGGEKFDETEEEMKLASASPSRSCSDGRLSLLEARMTIGGLGAGG